MRRKRNGDDVSTEGQASVSTGGSAVGARSVEGPAFVSTNGFAVSTRSLQDRRHMCNYLKFSFNNSDIGQPIACSKSIDIITK